MLVFSWKLSPDSTFASADRPQIRCIHDCIANKHRATHQDYDLEARSSADADPCTAYDRMGILGGEEASLHSSGSVGGSEVVRWKYSYRSHRAFLPLLFGFNAAPGTTLEGDIYSLTPCKAERSSKLSILYILMTNSSASSARTCQSRKRQ